MPLLLSLRTLVGRLASHYARRREVETLRLLSARSKEQGIITLMFIEQRSSCPSSAGRCYKKGRTSSQCSRESPQKDLYRRGFFSLAAASSLVLLPSTSFVIPGTI